MSDSTDGINRRKRGFDATRFCESCGRWTGHRMLDDGSYGCVICGGNNA